MMPDMSLLMRKLSEAPNIVVITLRRLGDVLLTTPLLGTLRQAYPHARIDAVVFEGTQAMLAGNRDVSNILTLPLKPSLAQLLALTRRLGQRYDVAISTQSGDRPIALAAAMGRMSIGLVGCDAKGGWWKRAVLTKAIEEDRSEHRVINLARLTDALALPRQLALVAPQGDVPRQLFPTHPYAVLHAAPMFAYRRWHEKGWVELAQNLAARGLHLVATGGIGSDERAYLDGLWGRLDQPILRLDGKLDFIGNAALLKGAKIYVGPDTSMSHLAAASGCPTVAIYGPASPHDIGPWPSGADKTPWQKSGRIQRHGKVAVVQHAQPCLPCGKSGCEGHLRSYSRCLDLLLAAQVIEAVDQVMAKGRA